MIASLALMLLSVFAPRATAAVVAEAGALSSIRSAPLPLPSFAAPPALSAPFPAASAALAAPSLVAAPAAAAAPLAPAPLAPAPALQAAPAAALSAAPPAARLVLAQAAVPEPATAAAAFDGGLRAPALDWAPAVAPIDGRPPSRLQLLSAAELGVEHEPEAPRPPSSDPQPFLYRHYRFARAVALPILKLLYRIRVDGLAQLPPGPVMIVPNHVSFLDPVLISYAANRPMRFLMYRPIYETLGLQWLFRSLGAVPISTKDPKDVIEESLNRLRRALAAGESVVIFPEGTVTRDGDFSPFRRGFERVALGLGVPVVPAFVDGMWGSALSRHPLKSWRRSLIAHLRGRRSTAVLFGPQLDRADAGLAREAVATLAAPHPVSAASSEARGGEFTFVERRGVNRFGQEIVLLDALDARDPGAGTAAHIDFSLGKGQASLDEPLDLSSTVKMPHPAGAPVEADLSHLPRPHLWFGLAVKPEYQGRGLGARILDAAVARMRLAGTRTLFIRATESSRDFYLRHFGASVRAVDSETDGEGETYYRLEVDLTKP